MDGCDCIEPQWPAYELLVKYQYISDFFIALAYFSIPLELIYFVKKSSFFPYRWVLMQFGAFIVLCGATHLINLWTFTVHSKTVAIVMTVAKVSTAVVSCATALMLVHIIPDLLSLKTREVFLKNKAEELDREMGLIRTQEETGRHVRMLTHEIRSTLDRHTILRTTLVELGRILDLEECALWMPLRSGLNLQLSHTLHHKSPIGSVIPVNLPVVTQVFSSTHAVRIPYTSPLARIRPLAGKYVPTEVVATVQENGIYMNLKLLKWWQIRFAVALSHAAILEESMRARDLLIEQNVAFDAARQEAETAIRVRNDFLAVMNHEMRTPMNAIIALSSMLLETMLTSEQRLMVMNLVRPVAAIKKLTILMSMSTDLPLFAVGDEKCLMQVILNLAGNAVKYTKEGYVSIVASTARFDLLRDLVAPEFYPVTSIENFYLHVQVKDTGCGVSPQDLPHSFEKYARVHAQSGTDRNREGTGLGLAICKRLTNLMEGRMWLDSEGFAKGCTANLVIKLGDPETKSREAKLSWAKTQYRGNNRLPPPKSSY